MSWCCMKRKEESLSLGWRLVSRVKATATVVFKFQPCCWTLAPNALWKTMEAVISHRKQRRRVRLMKPCVFVCVCGNDCSITHRCRKTNKKYVHLCSTTPSACCRLWGIFKDKSEFEIDVKNHDCSLMFAADVWWINVLQAKKTRLEYTKNKQKILQLGEECK